jgi:hypothetical protein
MNTPMDINDRLHAFLKGKPGVRHSELPCPETNSWYHGRSTAKGGQWQNEVTCPECGRKGRFLANYLGQRKVYCDGIKFTKKVPA